MRVGTTTDDPVDVARTTTLVLRRVASLTVAAMATREKWRRVDAALTGHGMREGRTAWNLAVESRILRARTALGMRDSILIDVKSKRPMARRSSDQTVEECVTEDEDR